MSIWWRITDYLRELHRPTTEQDIAQVMHCSKEMVGQCLRDMMRKNLVQVDKTVRPYTYEIKR
jgi:DNA-directed RNA polymerase specialized sigma subunit